MKLFFLIPATASLINGFLAIFVFSRNPRQILNQIFALWALAISIWNIGTALSFFAQDPRQGLACIRIIQTGVICLPFILFHLCSIVAQASVKKVLPVAYGMMFLFLASNLGGLFVKRVKYVEELGAYYSVGSAWYVGFSTVYLIVACSTCVMLWRAQKSASPLMVMKIRALLLANFLLILLGFNDILPILGLSKYPFTSIQIFPFGSAAAIFYGIIVGYSVLQHQLLDLQVTLSRSAAKLVRLGFLMLVGFVLLVAAFIFAPKGQVNIYSFFTCMAVLGLTGLIAVNFFPRIFGGSTDKLERRILGDYFEYQDRIAAFIQSVPWYTDHDDLFFDLDVLLKNAIGVQFFRIVLPNHLQNGFALFRGGPDFTDLELRDLPVEPRLLTHLRKQSSEVLGFNSLEPGELRLVREELAGKLQAENAELCFPCHADGDLFGFILLGPKLSGDPYTKTDAEALTLLFKNLTLVINQIRLKEQIKIEQELDLLGRMSKGLAHDLNNLLTPVWTFLQVTQAAPSDDPEMNEFVQTASRNIEIMRSYISDSLFFSKTMKPQMGVANLDDLVRKAVDTLQPNLREKSMNILFQPSGSITGTLDIVLFQRLVRNLVSNAIDASLRNSAVEVDLTRTRMPHDKASFRLRVIDHGEGITAENLERIKAAFFTTKDSGDGKRGFGLGLAICRKIVHLHGGTLNISSQRGLGTTVQVDLPNGTLPALVQQPDFASAA